MTYSPSADLNASPGAAARDAPDARQTQAAAAQSAAVPPDK
jgi:hypothetical protein